MTTVYIITRYLTFPGAIFRAFLEHLVCRMYGIPVEDNRLLRGDEMCSHIEHELAPTSRKAFMIAFIPPFITALFALLLAVPSVISLFYLRQSGFLNTLAVIAGYYIACSLYVNRYSGIEDALNMKYNVYHEGTVLQKIVYSIGFVFCFIGSYLERYCVTFLAAAAGTVLLTMAF